MSKHPKTIIEFIEPSLTPSETTCHKAREVRVNGVPVLVEAEPIIDFGAGGITSVTMTFLPTEIHFRAALPYEEQS